MSLPKGSGLVVARLCEKLDGRARNEWNWVGCGQTAKRVRVPRSKYMKFTLLGMYGCQYAYGQWKRTLVWY